MVDGARRVPEGAAGARLRGWADSALGRLPGLCAVCGGWGRGRLCDACTLRFSTQAPCCQRCALRVPPGRLLCGRCLVDPPPYRRTLAAVRYEHPWDGLIARFKFHAALDLAPAFARLMLGALERSPHFETACGRLHSGDATTSPVLLPMPLGPARSRERGYNQAWELARRLGTALGWRADGRTLVRTRDTPPQQALPTAQRISNVRDAFDVTPRGRALVDGRRVVLVDDVMTTGATAAEASRVLMQVGAAGISVWVVARTPRPSER